MPRFLAFALFSFISTVCWSTKDNAVVCTAPSELEVNWAKIRYQTPANQRMEMFETMLTSLGKAPQQCLATAEYLIIEAMIRGSMIKLKSSSFSTLKKINKIKKLLDQAINKNPAAMEGLGWTLLGLLFDKSPGWPLSIGNNDKAENAYKKGLEYNPAGIDSNYYFGDFLRRKDLPLQAQRYLLIASQAEQRAGREIAHQGRLKDVQRVLLKLSE
jgi:tetratricopeptide (TPR) repeat protein